MKQHLVNYSKNLGGWTTKRKILCFAVDDYGNVRLHDSQSLLNLKKFDDFGDNRFDILDTLDTKEDYEELFKVLNSVKDQHGRPAIFTTYALYANIDFDKVIVYKEMHVSFQKILLFFF